jgi:hypothetical protein
LKGDEMSKKLTDVLRPPKGHISNHVFNEDLAEAVKYGCDWLELMVGKYGMNVMADAIKESIERR